MAHYGSFLRNLRRSTNLLFRHRDRKGVRRLRSTDGGIPLVGKRRRRPAGAATMLLRLAGPALAVSLLGVLALHEPGNRLRERVAMDDFWLPVFCLVTLVFMVRSLTATAPRGVRILAFAACLPFPVALAMHLLG